jgi:hypothetical protein
MFSVWRTSTIVFVLQAALGLAMFVETGSVFGSAAIVTVVTFLLLSGLKTRTVIDDLFAVLCPAFFAVLAVTFATAPIIDASPMLAIIAGVAAFGMSMVAARDRFREREPQPLVFLIVLPLGIGVVLGGLTLLYRQLYDTANQPIA